MLRHRRTVHVVLPGAAEGRIPTAVQATISKHENIDEGMPLVYNNQEIYAFEHDLHKARRACRSV
ncbi:hypothetical protein [Hespellia stercorisuis]|uniref:hypothetical protein n=1 Tax=Hespellia stercorisuis TaxID=180311 RepID=UPI001160D84E|nr:hypothetical protein [Hespellia stercorisuis]